MVVEQSHATEELDSKTFVGFWMYIMTDCMLFATLFATFQVLRHNTFGGPPLRELVGMPFVLVETLALLTSSYTSGLILLAAHQKKMAQTYFWAAITFLLGALFVGMELTEFHHLATEGHSWTKSASLSSFFTLVGTHGAHVTSGLIWLAVLLAQISKKGLTSFTMRRLTCFNLFWHFLDIVWIFIFTIVYLLGVLV